MKTTKSKTAIDSKCGHYMARGALLWGPLYTTGVSGAVYAIAPSLSGDVHSYSEVLLNALIVCPSMGAAGGYIRWKLIGEKSVDAAGSKPAKRRTMIHRLITDRRTGHRKAA